MMTPTFWKRLFYGLRHVRPAGSGASPQPRTGKLYLVGVGVGDPDNITVRAQNVLRQAQVIFISPRRREQFAELLAGKELHEPGRGLFKPMQRRYLGDDEAQALEERIQRIIRAAVADGKTVAVVDYGDPTVYGPQQGYLQAFRDLNPEVVPGISSFNAANAALATAITGGKHSSSVILTRAKAAQEGYDGQDSLPRLAQTRSSMALFTMKMDLPRVVAQLKTHYPGDTPAALVLYAGESQRQRVIRATLDTLEAAVHGVELPFEHLLYVGDFLEDQA